MNPINAQLLFKRKHKTLGELIDAIDEIDGHECFNLLIHDGLISTLYSPREIELFNDEFLSRTLLDVSPSYLSYNHALTLHVTI